MTISISSLKNPELIASETYRITGFSDQLRTMAEKNGVLWFAYQSGVNSIIRGWVLSRNRPTPVGPTLSNALIEGLAVTNEILIVLYRDRSDTYRNPGQNYDLWQQKLKAFIINSSNTLTEIAGFNPKTSRANYKVAANGEKLWTVGHFSEAYDITATSTTISIERDPANDFIDHESTLSGHADATLANDEIITIDGGTPQRLATFDITKTPPKLTKRKLTFPDFPIVGTGGGRGIAYYYGGIASNDRKLYISEYRLRQTPSTNTNIVVYNNDKTSSSNVQLVALTDEDNHDMFPKKVWTTSENKNPKANTSDNFTVTNFSDRILASKLNGNILWVSRYTIQSNVYRSYIRAWSRTSSSFVSAEISIYNVLVSGLSIINNNTLLVVYTDFGDLYRPQGQTHRRGKQKLRAYNVSNLNSIASIGDYLTNELQIGPIESNNETLWAFGTTQKAFRIESPLNFVSDPSKIISQVASNVALKGNNLWLAYGSNPQTWVEYDVSKRTLTGRMFTTNDFFGSCVLDDENLYLSSYRLSGDAGTTTVFNAFNVGKTESEEVYSQNPAVPVISAFSSNPTDIDEDASPPTNITLTWNTSGTVTHQTLTDLHRNANVPLSGNHRAVVARPQQTTVYSLVARNNFGSTSARITVPVFKDPVISSLTVQYTTDPFSPHGATVYLNWTVSGKPFPTLSADHGIGVITPRHTNQATGVGRIAHTFAGPDNFTITLTASNIQANNQRSSTTRTVSVTIP